jgi:hypothetical protein
MTLTLPHRFKPRHYQSAVMRALVDGTTKRAVCVWHRRAGKDKTFLNIVAIKAMQVMGNYAYYFPTATLGRKAMWDNIDANSGMRVIDHLPPEIVSKVNEQQMKITLVNGSTIQILGTETLDVVGGNPIGVVFSEAAQHRPDAWDYIRPILRENGGWALFNGTPRGKNWFFKLYDMARQNPEWFCQLLTIEDTGVLNDEDIEAERAAGMREEMIQQEFFCDWSAALPGAIYGKVIERARRDGRLCPMPVEGSSLVNTSWDLGSPRNTCVWYWQVVGREIRIIDCDMGFEGTLIERVAFMLGKGYNLGKHYLPHDCEQTERSGTTFLAELAKAGLTGLTTVPRCHSIWMGINHLCEMFGSLAFRTPQCDHGIEALSAYRERLDINGGIGGKEPIHDWASHPADALRTMAEAHRAGMFKWGVVENRADWYGETKKRKGMKAPKVG